MKKRILCLFLAIFMLVGTCAALTACGGDGDKDCTHVNEDADGKCDKCGETIKHKHKDDDEDGKCDVCSKDMSEEEEVIEYPWADDDPVELLFQMTHNSDVSQNPSGCERYLAGEDPNAIEEIDDMVADRNSEAEYETNVAPVYQYYLDVDEYGWGECIEKILTIVNSGTTKDAPDVYCNFTYDLVGASLKGAFANLKNTELKNGNYFEFLDEDYDETVDNRGYMYDYMNSTTLSQEKVYILASDYFLDLIRSFFIVPVNIKLLESVDDPLLTVDKNGDGVFTIDDFYEEVKEKKWTYNKVAAYSAAIYENTGEANPAEDIEDVLGFAVGWGGVFASGVIYSTDITIISKEWDDSKGDYVYDYPTDSPQLYELFDNLSTLVNSTGVAVIKSGADVNKYGSDCRIAVRNRFCDNKVLFGSIILVGALEYEAYQKLKGSSGFGVVPVPLYHEVAADSTETYLTSIHNNARPGAIAKNTQHFAECTAFLNYQSTHSNDILNKYYNENLQYNIAGGASGTVEMLQYIRLNVRSAFDKTFEDAIGVFNADQSSRWHHILSVNDYDHDIRADYQSKISTKKERIQTLYNEYPKLP